MATSATSDQELVRSVRSAPRGRRGIIGLWSGVTVRRRILDLFPFVAIRRHWRLGVSASLVLITLASLAVELDIVLVVVVLATLALSWRHLVGREVWPAIVTGDLTRATQRCWDEWQRRDWPSMAPRMATDIEMIDMAEGQTHRGPAAVSARLRRFTESFPDGTLEVLQTDEATDRTTSQLAFWGHQDGPYAGRPPTGALVYSRFCEVFAFRDGQIIRVEEHYDRLSMLEQFGLPPEQDARPLLGRGTQPARA